jgi:glycosyltransferase involved in cell wall biosynthesis
VDSNGGKPRIAILGVKFFPSRGGTSRVVESTLRALADDYDFTVYCYRHEAARAHVPGVRVVEIPAPRLPGVGVFAYYARCMLHALRADYDLVHVHKLDAAFLLPALAWRSPCIATCHELPYLNEKWSAFARGYFRVMEWVMMRSPVTRTCVSREQQRYFRERYGSDVEHVPNGVEEPRPDRAGARELLARHGVEGGFLLFAARRIIPLKGLHTLLDALHRISFRGTLVVAGDESHTPAYVAEVKRRAEGLDVRFVGFVEDPGLVMGLVGAADAFMFPSEREGMSLMLLEVAAVGTPVLCSDIPQNRDVLEEDEAIWFRSKDAADLAEKVEWVRSNADEVAARAGRARKRVAERFSAEGVARRYARIYDDALR